MDMNTPRQMQLGRWAAALRVGLEDPKAVDKVADELIEVLRRRFWAVSRTYLVSGETEIRTVEAETALEAVAKAWGFVGEDWSDLEDELNKLGIGIGVQAI
jgi:hypothetical protein